MFNYNIFDWIYNNIKISDKVYSIRDCWIGYIGVICWLEDKI